MISIVPMIVKITTIESILIVLIEFDAHFCFFIIFCTIFYRLCDKIYPRIMMREGDTIFSEETPRLDSIGGYCSVLEYKK